MLPVLVTTPTRSPSPFEGQADVGLGFPDLVDQVHKVFPACRVRVVVREVAIDFTERGMTSQFSASINCGAITPAAPLPQSTTTFRRRASLTSWTISLVVAVEDLDLGDAALAAAQVVGLEAVVQGLDLFVGQGVAGT